MENDAPEPVVDDWTPDMTDSCLFHLGMCALFAVIDLIAAFIVDGPIAYICAAVSAVMILLIAQDMYILRRRLFEHVPFNKREVVEGFLLPPQGGLFVIIVLTSSSVLPGVFVALAALCLVPWVVANLW